jgi:anti-sigma B factor antagonist
VPNGDAATPLSSDCSMRHEQHLGTTIIRLMGEFDLSSEEGFQAELCHLLDSSTRTLMLDLRGLKFIDSTGLRMLVQIDAVARQDGFDLSVMCGDGQVRYVLQQTGLDGVLPVVDPFGTVPASDSPV